MLVLPRRRIRSSGPNYTNQILRLMMSLIPVTKKILGTLRALLLKACTPPSFSEPPPGRPSKEVTMGHSEEDITFVDSEHPYDSVERARDGSPLLPHNTLVTPWLPRFYSTILLGNCILFLLSVVFFTAGSIRALKSRPCHNNDEAIYCRLVDSVLQFYLTKTYSSFIRFCGCRSHYGQIQWNFSQRLAIQRTT